MVETLIKEVEDAVVAIAERQERLVSENKVVLRGAADAITGVVMDSIYGRVLEDMVYP